METVVSKWGNSLGIRLPKNVVKENRLLEGSVLEIELSNGVIILKPKKRMRFKLDDLLEGINESNLHGEINTGGSVGNELW
jgi:antitoxin MazE